MRTSGDTSVATTTSMWAILLTAVLTGTALIGTAAWAHADESGSTDRSTTGVRSQGSQQLLAPHVLTELARPRFPAAPATP